MAISTKLNPCAIFRQNSHPALTQQDFICNVNNTFLFLTQVGVHIPLIAMKHAYVTTERIPGIENMPNVRDHDASVYLKLQGNFYENFY